jgi:hypothetical protein
MDALIELSEVTKRYAAGGLAALERARIRG